MRSAVWKRVGTAILNAVMEICFFSIFLFFFLYFTMHRKYGMVKHVAMKLTLLL